MDVTHPPTKPRFSPKSLTSFCIAGLLIVMGVSGVVLYASPRCRDAYDAGWTLFGLDKDTWDALHTNTSLLFLIVAVAHLVLNWKVFWSYIRRRSQQGVHRKKELALASVALGAVVAGTVAGWSPFRKPLDWRFEVKNYWSQVTRHQPRQQVTEWTLAELASRYGQSADDMIRSLDGKGYGPIEPTQTIRQIASQKGVSPRAVLEDLRTHLPLLLTAAPGGGRGGWRSGRGPDTRRNESGRGPWWLAVSFDRAQSQEGDADAGPAPGTKGCRAGRGGGGCQAGNPKRHRGGSGAGRCSRTGCSGGECNQEPGARCANSGRGRCERTTGRHGLGGGRHCGRGHHGRGHHGGGHGPCGEAGRNGEGRCGTGSGPGCQEGSCPQRSAGRRQGGKRDCCERTA
ncbi:MAG TPA: DUF4405 domain-containing protein [Planctomycetaceae bacterium]|nr:DUF4405 domain-containing protein [Planctomycetaceae bacterium]